MKKQLAILFTFLCLGAVPARADEPVLTFYQQWKQKYFHRDGQQAYIAVNTDGQKLGPETGASGEIFTVSEAQGYGMMLIAYMAPQDPAGHDDFDALYRFYRHHPCLETPYLMAWEVGPKTLPESTSSASDGDLDIAYSLLLADKEWGSKGSIDYRREAVLILKELLRFDLNSQTGLIGLGSFIDAEQTKYYYGVRTSDFMPTHFKAFAKATGDARWTQIVDKFYGEFEGLQKKYAAKTGLVPDFFLVHPHAPTVVAPPNYLERPQDGAFNYNACRFPWRVGLDALLNKDERAIKLLTPLNHWIAQAAHGDAGKIMDGYALDGKPSSPHGQNSQAFVAPFAVASMVGTNQDKWTKACWFEVEHNSELKDEDYFGNTIKALCMVVHAGKWWQP